MKTDWVSKAELGNVWSAQVINRESAIRTLKQFQTVSIGDLCQIESGQYVDEYVDDFRDEGIAPYIRVDNIRPFVANLNPVDLALIRIGHSAVVSRSLISKDDVLIARTGTLGKATLAVRELIGGVISQHITRLIVKGSFRDKISPEFLCAFLNSSPGRSQLLAGGFGSTRLELTHKRLSEVQVPLIGMDLHPQLQFFVRRGVENLAGSGEEIRAAIELYSSVFSLDEKTDSRRQWVDAAKLLDRWTPRFHCTNVSPLFESLPASYEIVPLGQIAQISRGKGTRSADYERTGIPFIRTTSLINGGIDPFPDHFASLETYRRYNQQIKKGDILLSIEGKIGQVAFLTEMDRCVFKNHIELVRPKDQAWSLDIFLALASIVGQLQMRRLTVVQATLPGLASRSREILIPLSRRKRIDSCGRIAQAHSEALRRLQRGFLMRKRGLQDLSSAASLVDLIFS